MLTKSNRNANEEWAQSTEPRKREIKMALRM